MTLPAYFHHSSHRFYGAVTALGMLFLYEVLIIWNQLSGVVIRNAPEAWLRTILYYVGIPPYYITFILITGSLAAILIFYQSRVVMKKSYFLIMFAESIVLGLVSGFIIQWVVYKLLFFSGSMTGSIVGDLGLAIGAGLFEELFFRVILTTSLIWIFRIIIPAKIFSIILAVLIASFLFSLAHYVGSAGEVFEAYSFIFRFVAGLWFTVLYVLRGFAVVSLTHAFYDIFVILVYSG